MVVQGCSCTSMESYSTSIQHWTTMHRDGRKWVKGQAKSNVIQLVSVLEYFQERTISILVHSKSSCCLMVSFLSRNYTHGLRSCAMITESTIRTNSKYLHERIVPLHQERTL